MNNSDINTNQAAGVNTWWNLNRKVVDYHTLLMDAEDNGTEKFLPEPSFKKAFSNAFRFFDSRKKRILARPLTQDAYTYSFSLVFENCNKEDALSYNQATTGKLDKKTGSISVEGPMADQVIEKYNELKNALTDDDMRIYIRRVIENASCGIAKRPTGGIYFVPEIKVDVLKDLKSFIENNGFGRVYIERVFNGEEERSNIWETFKDVAQNKIEETLEKVDNIGRGYNCAARHSETIDELEELTNLYAEMTGNMDDIKELMDDFEFSKKEILEKAKSLKSESEKKKAKRLAKK